MMEVNIVESAGSFAEDKDIARDLRVKIIMPEVEKGNFVTLNFINVDSATQSFIHALISEVIRIEGIDSLDRINFKECSPKVRTIIEIVVDYVQDGIFSEPAE